MVAGGDDIRAGIDRFQIDVFCNPEAASGVLAIDDDEIQFQVGDQPRQFFPDGPCVRSCPPCLREKVVSCPCPARKMPQAAFGQNCVQRNVMRFSRH